MWSDAVTALIAGIASSMSDEADLLRLAARRDQQDRKDDADFLRLMALYFKKVIEPTEVRRADSATKNDR